jgi:hypothetical protein
MAILRGAHSWLCITDPDAKQTNVEADCFACAHCGRITKVPPEARHYTINYCRKCMDPAKPGSGRVCDACYGKECRPLEQWVEQHERLGRQFREF